MSKTRGQLLRAHRERRRMTELQCAKQAGVPHAVWKSLEQDEPITVQPELRVFIDKFTDGEVSA